jgi:hypothetical protein
LEELIDIGTHSDSIAHIDSFTFQPARELLKKITYFYLDNPEWDLNRP